MNIFSRPLGMVQLSPAGTSDLPALTLSERLGKLEEAGPLQNAGIRNGDPLFGNWVEGCGIGLRRILDCVFLILAQGV